MSTPLLVLDLFGVLVFALSGGLVGVRNRLDLFGVTVLATLTGLGGGILRDLLIGAVPPASLQDWRYLLAGVVGGLITFRFRPGLERIERFIACCDAVGLGVFCVTGAVKALSFGLPPVTAALLGMLTGIGGGVLRDLLAGRTPLVLREEVYALPALAGASVVVLAWSGGWYAPWVAVLGAGVCITIRLLALRFRWQLPSRLRHD